jgi:transposase
MRPYRCGSLERWAALTRFLDDGRVCLSNNAAERALRGIAVGNATGRWQSPIPEAGRRHLHPHRDRQAQRRRPRGWLADMLARIADHPANRFAELLPPNWKARGCKRRRQLPTAPATPCGAHLMLTR